MKHFLYRDAIALALYTIHAQFGYVSEKTALRYNWPTTAKEMLTQAAAFESDQHKAIFYVVAGEFLDTWEELEYADSIVTPDYFADIALAIHETAIFYRMGMARSKGKK